MVWSSFIPVCAEVVSGMNRRQFLSGLEELWGDVMFYNEPLDLEDLLDDAATLGVEGASELYLEIIKAECIHGLKESDGCSCFKKKLQTKQI